MFGFLVAGRTEGYQIGQLVGLPVIFVLAWSVAEFTKGADMMHVQCLFALLAFVAAMAAGVVIALSCAASLPIPIGAIVRLPSTAPMPIVTAGGHARFGAPLAHALEIAKGFWVSRDVRNCSVETFSAIKTYSIGATHAQLAACYMPFVNSEALFAACDVAVVFVYVVLIPLHYFSANDTWSLHRAALPPRCVFARLRCRNVFAKALPGTRHAARHLTWLGKEHLAANLTRQLHALKFGVVVTSRVKRAPNVVAFSTAKMVFAFDEARRTKERRSALFALRFDATEISVERADERFLVFGVALWGAKVTFSLLQLVSWAINLFATCVTMDNLAVFRWHNKTLLTKSRADYFGMGKARCQCPRFSEWFMRPFLSLPDYITGGMYG